MIFVLKAILVPIIIIIIILCKRNKWIKFISYPKICQSLTWNFSAARERISLVASEARADGIMICDAAFSISAAESGARVATFLSDTGCGLGALGADETLWPAVWRRAYLVRQTGADTHAVLLFLLAVGTAWVRITWVQLFNDRHSGGHKRALGDCITSVSLQAGTYRHMSDRVADGIDAAGARTGIQTLVVDAGAVGRAVGVEDTLGSAREVGVPEVARYTGTGACSPP